VSSVDPRRLIPALQEYEHELRRWMDLTITDITDCP